MTTERTTLVDRNDNQEVELKERDRRRQREAEGNECVRETGQRR